MTGFCYGQQRPVLFGGFEYYRNKSYDANAYANISIGFQLYKWRFLAPEVGFNYYFGSIKDRELLSPEEPQARPPYKSDGRFGAAVFSFSPKMVFGNREAALVVIPQYNIGTINVRGDFLKNSTDRYFLEDQIEHSEHTSFWSIAGGIQGQFYETETLFFSLLLSYTFLDTKHPLERIEEPGPYPQLNEGSTEGIGISVRVYFDFLKALSGS